MEQTNLPSSSSALTNSPTSLQVSADKLNKALAQFGPEYTELVFGRYKQPPASIAKAAESKAPTFHDVTNLFSRDATLMWLRFHIAMTFAFLGIYDTASKFQVRQMAELIIDHEVFGQMNLDEFLQFLTQFKRGDYGKIYQSARPNPQEFLMCLRPYWNELVDHRIRVRKQIEAEDARKRSEEHKKVAMPYEDYLEIKMLTDMYNPPAPPKEIWNE